MPKFPQFPLDRMGEADVREEMLSPLVRALGYQTGTRYDVVRELSLRYPKEFLGRKIPEKDTILRGRADYILDVDKKLRWVLEAKAPSEVITPDVIEQTWTYANHAEVRAIYFAICNGWELQIFRTTDAPTVGAKAKFPYSEWDERFAEVADILGPAALLRDFGAESLQVGAPVGPGLRGFAKVLNGIINQTTSDLPSAPMLDQLQTSIVDGSLQRDKEGHLIGFLKTHAPFRAFQQFNESLGLDCFEMKSVSGELSTDKSSPTEFVHSDTVTLPKGAEVLDLRTWQTVRLPISVTCETKTRAIGYLDHDCTFRGSFSTEIRALNIPMPPAKVHGDFFVKLQ